MIDTQAIRNKILDLAMRGQLTEQLPEDGTAEDFYSTFKTRPKRCTPITSEDLLFDIPLSWKWCRFSEVADFHLGKTPARGDSSFWENGLYPWVSISDMSGKILMKTKEKVSQAAADTCFSRGISPKNTLLMSFKLTIGKVVILGIDAYHNEAIISIFPRNDIDYIFRDYLKHILPFSAQHGKIYGAIKGNTLNKDSLSDLLVPLPPLAEQKRITEKIEQAFSVLDTIDSLQAQYADNLTALKAKLIDAAIQGKLTEQLPEDGSVEELYARVQKDKTNILRERKGRADKNIKEVSDDVPYDIPAHWKWIRFGELGLFKKGPFGSALTKSMFVPKSSDTVKVYEQQHAIKKDPTLGTYYITKEYFDEKMNGFEVKSGDILISCAGTIGETYVMPDDIEQGIINQALMRVTLVPGINKRFFQYYFDSNLKSSARAGNGSAIVNIPPFDVIKNWYFPLAPIEEQERIVTRLEEVFAEMKI